MAVPGNKKVFSTYLEIGSRAPEQVQDTYRTHTIQRVVDTVFFAKKRRPKKHHGTTHRAQASDVSKLTA
jgi:hypothetical protein